MRQIGIALCITFQMIAICFIGYQQYISNRSNHTLFRMIERQREHQISLEKNIAITGVSVTDRAVGEGVAWRDIQTKVRDTVVQVFSQLTETDILRPFKTPVAGGACGSAFFISDQGELITNAHVVNQAQSVWIQIPSLGKRIVDVDVIGISPERDLALLRVVPKDLAIVQRALNSIPYLDLGNSDLVHRADCVMALGYPLGQQSLKSTTGVISGREQHMIQMSAPINPGSSGGPLLNADGHVVGINASGITEAQNVGYIIPINDLKIILDDLRVENGSGDTNLVRKPFLGVLMNNATEALAKVQGNPIPAGAYVVEIVKNSPLYKAGIEKGDMLYQIDGYDIDQFGEMNVPWSEDKISVVDYVSRLCLGQDVDLILYRQGERLHRVVKFEHTEQPPIRRIYPGYEKIDYEIFGGMVVCELSLNHVQMLSKVAPGLAKFADLNKQTEPVLVITHIFPDSQLHRSRCICIGATLEEINGMRVHTLSDFRMALSTVATDTFYTIKALDHSLRFSEEVLVVLTLDDVIKECPRLARNFGYKVSPIISSVIDSYEKYSMRAHGKITA